MEIALAIVLSAAIFAATIYLLGQKALRLYGEDVGAPLSGPVSRDTPDDDDLTDEDLDEEVVGFVKQGMESIAAMEFQEWLDEKREQGLDDHEIQELLDRREPVVII